MGFRRSALLSVMAMGFMTGTMLCRPVYAEEGELIAQENTAQINVRSLANTQADIVAAGAVGDRVQILEHSVGNDGLIWYRAKLLKSGESGWIRGDLIKILGGSTEKTAQKSVPQAKAAEKSAPVTLTPPKPPASAKSLASAVSPAKPAASKPASKPTNKPATPAPPSNWGGAEISAAASSASPTAAAQNASTTIITFQTSTYAVRVFSKSGQLRLNLFNRKTKAIALSAVPVESKSSGEGTTYSYQSDVKITVLVPASGQPTLSAAALGETLKEQQEASPKAEQPESSPTPSTPSPTSGSPAPAPQ